MDRIQNTHKYGLPCASCEKSIPFGAKMVEILKGVLRLAFHRECY